MDKVEEIQALRDLERSPAWQLCREAIQAQVERALNKSLVASRSGASIPHYLGCYEMAIWALGLPQKVIDELTEREEDNA